MNELHLFAGAGGGILGGLLLGHRPVCAVEFEPYCREVLLQRQRDGILPWFPVWDDVRTFDGRPWRGIADIVCGGFPCQDISVAGKGAGIEGERSGLWVEMVRIIREVRPRYCFIENSPMLVGRGLDRVLWDLATMGFDARWGVVSAEDAAWSGGNPSVYHERQRIWILGRRWGGAVEGADADEERQSRLSVRKEPSHARVRVHGQDAGRACPDPHETGREQQRRPVSDATKHPPLNAVVKVPTPLICRPKAEKMPTPGAAKANNDVGLTCSGDGRSKPNKLGWAVAESLRVGTPTSHPRTHEPRDVDHGIQLANQVGGSLNPNWVEWLMGWIPGMSSLEPLSPLALYLWRSLHGHFNCGTQASTEKVSCDGMQCVWYERKANEPSPHQQKHVRQQTGKCPDSLFTVPLGRPSGDGRSPVCPASNVCRMRQDFSTEEDVSRTHLLRSLPVISRTETGGEEMGWETDHEDLCLLWQGIQIQATERQDLLAFLWQQARMGSTWWECEPPMIPRTAKAVPNRTHRLKAIGNGQVPLAAAMAWRLLMESF